MSNDPYAAPSANLDNSSSAATIPTSVWNARGRLSVLSYLAHSFVLMLIFGLIFAAVVAVAMMMGAGQGGMPTDLDSVNFSNPVIIVAAVLAVIVYILFIYITVCMMIKRLHDRNHSGWWSLAIFVGSVIPFVNFVAIIGMIYVIFFPGQKTGNRFGGRRETRGWEKVLGIIYVVLMLAAIASGLFFGVGAYMNA